MSKILTPHDSRRLVGVSVEIGFFPVELTPRADPAEELTSPVADCGAVRGR
jgi:hypothetical protein